MKWSSRAPAPPAIEAGKGRCHCCDAHSMSQLGQERQIWAIVGTSVVALNADICLRRNI